jgi:hypothetical protein
MFRQMIKVFEVINDRHKMYSYSIVNLISVLCYDKRGCKLWEGVNCRQCKNHKLGAYLDIYLKLECPANNVSIINV